MKILVTNAVALNGGDAAILYGLLRILRHTFGGHIDVTVYDSQAEAAARHHPDIRFRPGLYGEVIGWSGEGIRRKAALCLTLLAAKGWRNPMLAFLGRLLPDRLRTSLADYATADLVVATGGTYLVPSHVIAPKIFDFLVTLASGRPLVLFTQSLGPFTGWRDRLLLRFVFRRARLILLRDVQSRRHLAELGVRVGHVHVLADAAFALATSRFRARPPRPSATLDVAISVRDWPHFRRQPAAEGMARYLDAVAALASVLIERHGARVTFLSTCQGIPDYWTDDARTAEHILDRVPVALRDRIAVDHEFHAPTDLIRRFGDFDLVVATRMHAAILALCAGVAVLPIAYEFKTRQLFNRLGFGDLVQDIESVTAAGLIQACETLLEPGRTADPGFWKRVADERAAAFAAGPLLSAASGAPT